MKLRLSNASGRSIVGVTVLTIWMGVSAWAISAKEVGAKADVVTLRDGSIRQGMTDFSSNSAKFSTGDTGKAIVITGAGAEGRDLVTKIQAVTSAKQVTLADTAFNSVNGALTYYGTDDTAAIRSCVYEGTARGGECIINDGSTFLASNSFTKITALAANHNPIVKGVIAGHGTIIFAPQGQVKSGVNDRLFYLTSQESQPMQIAGAIARGATSFRAQDASDAAQVSPGDWVIITERDSSPAAADTVFVDWMQVSDVDGATIRTSKPFRMAFPNARPWSGPPHFWGLSFRKVGPITSNVTVKDITIIVPRVVKIPTVNHLAVVGIVTRATRGTTIANFTCKDASGNCFAGLLDQGLTFENNHINDAVFSEFASMVDITISGNRINLPGTEFSLPGLPTSGGLEVDFGTGFSNVVDNTIGRTRQVCIQVSPGIHDTLVKGNDCDVVTFGTGANCIMSRGGYRMTVTENTCAGGTGPGSGISFGDENHLTAPILSDGNRIFNNRLRGFPKAYACDSRLRTDACDNR